MHGETASRDSLLELVIARGPFIAITRLLIAPALQTLTKSNLNNSVLFL